MLKKQMVEKMAEQEGLLETLKHRVRTAIETSDEAEHTNLKLKGIIAHLEIELATVKGYAARVIQEDNAKIPLPEVKPFVKESGLIGDVGELMPSFNRPPSIEHIRPFGMPEGDQPSGAYTSVKEDSYPYNDRDVQTEWYRL